MLVACLASDQECGRTVYLPLFYTEDGYDCITGRSHEPKPDFDTAFAIARSLFEEEISTPAHVGTFELFNNTYQCAVWRGV